MRLTLKYSANLPSHDSAGVVWLDFTDSVLASRQPLHCHQIVMVHKQMWNYFSQTVRGTKNAFMWEHHSKKLPEKKKGILGLLLMSPLQLIQLVHTFKYTLPETLWLVSLCCRLFIVNVLTCLRINQNVNITNIQKIWLVVFNSLSVKLLLNFIILGSQNNQPKGHFVVLSLPACINLMIF